MICWPRKILSEWKSITDELISIFNPQRQISKLDLAIQFTVTHIVYLCLACQYVLKTGKFKGTFVKELKNNSFLHTD